MSSNSGLESTIDQVLERNSSEFSQSLKNSLTDAQKILSDSLPMLEEEYEKIFNESIEKMIQSIPETVTEEET